MAFPFDFEVLTPEEAEEWQDLWATAQQSFPDLDRETVARIVSLVLGTCGVCHENPAPCWCNSDD